MYLLDTDVSKLPIWLIIAGLGFIVIFILIAIATGREVTFWPPKIAAKPVTDPSAKEKTTPKIKEDYGIKILSPIPGEEVPLKFVASGTFEKQPPLYAVAAFMLNETSGEYWPKRDILFDPHTKTWHTEVNNGNTNTDPKIKRLLIIAEVGDEAKALVNYYRKVGESTGAWVGLNNNVIIDKDVRRLAQVNVRFRRP